VGRQHSAPIRGDWQRQEGGATACS
jgi:hypothetical protein